MKRYPTTLIIAGSDSSGGAGIQADIKTCSALGVYATTAITAITAQNTQGVTAIQTATPRMVQQQIEAVLEDFTVDSIKVGMLGNADITRTVADVLKHVDIPIILDPVMVSTSGHTLLSGDAIEILIEQLLPISEIITPNIAEACLLTQQEIKSAQDVCFVAQKLLNMGCNSVLIKGGHLSQENATDILATQQGSTTFSHPFITTHNTHGTGCTLSTAIAAYRALGKSMAEAVKLAKDYVYNAIASGADVCAGQGHGPLNHLHNPHALIPIEYQPQ